MPSKGCVPEYHYTYTQMDYRTELYYFQCIFGNYCSVITEPICFWNSFVSEISLSTGLLNPSICLTEAF